MWPVAGVLLFAIDARRLESQVNRSIPIKRQMFDHAPRPTHQRHQSGRRAPA